MSAFDRAIEHVRQAEGGLSDRVEDRGGLTKFGISQRAYPDVDIRALTWPEAAAIYKRDYWDSLRLDDLPELVSIKTMDIAVNLGVGGATKVLQRALVYLGADIPVDGSMGPRTTAAVRSCRNLDALLAAIAGYQFMHYAELVEAKPSQVIFAAGWAKRALWVPA